MKEGRLGLFLTVSSSVDETEKQPSRLQGNSGTIKSREEKLNCMTVDQV